ncbi:MAG: acyl carrier protein [Minwuia sp.]|uniref:acyl carrier protein n=1 Tax=Minwuia sp. TaxID=2493630 RepID=UPI003A8B670D
MQESDVLPVIEEIMRELTDDPDLNLDRDTTADDVDLWDSVLHVKMMIAIESQFGIRFETEELNAPELVGELIDLVIAKKQA